MIRKLKFMSERVVTVRVCLRTYKTHWLFGKANDRRHAENGCMSNLFLFQRFLKRRKRKKLELYIYTKVIMIISVLCFFSPWPKVCLVNNIFLPVNDAWRTLVDCIGLLFNGVNVAVLSSFDVDEEKSALDNDGDIYSDNDCSILLGRRTLIDERPLLLLLFKIDDAQSDDDEDDVSDEDKEIISLLRSTIGACCCCLDCMH